MTPERWQRISDVFLEVVQVDPGRRSDVLLASCGDDADLRRAVEKLLTHDDSSPYLSTGPSPIRAVFGNGAVADRLIGQRFGSYLMRRLLGRGGMGSVYLADRVSDYDQHVALKVLHQAVSDPESLRRFQAEVQFLAAMGEHPNIATLLDAGHTADGTPYFVMEFVDGERIDRYCDRQCLNTRRRLELFRSVCAAVQFAHQHTVIHRDLKPSNILVRDDGTPKLIDFGIAKPTLDGQTDDATRTEFRALTPEYASPEQLLGRRLTTASDVYSLGVVLYELLTGHRPHRAVGHDLITLAQSVTAQEPEKPSTVIDRRHEWRSPDGPTTTISPDSVSQCRDATPQKLRRQLSGDLDNIVLMALRKEPERRYASVEQFAADVERHLSGHPVIARQDTFTYRAGKFFRRNQSAVLASALLLVTLVAGSIGSVTGWVTALRERDVAAGERTEAKKSAARAQAINRFLTKDVLSQAAPENNAVEENTTVRAALDRAALKIDTAFADQPELGASVRAVIADTYFALGLYAEAEDHWRAALRTFQMVLGKQHPDTLAALSGLSMAMDHRGNAVGAEARYRSLIDTCQEVLGPDDRLTRSAINNLAEVLHFQGKLPEAERLHLQNLDTLRRLFGPDDRDTLLCMNNLAALRFRQGRMADAEELFRQAFAGRQRVLGPNHPLTLATMSNLAVALKNQGKLSEAEPLYRRAWDADRRVQGPEHPETLTDMHNLASLLLAQKKLDDAEKLFRETLALRRKVLTSTHHPHIAYTLVGLAETLIAKHQYEDADSLLREALDIRTKVLPECHPDIIRSACLLADCLVELKQFDKAEAILLVQHEALVKHPKTATSQASEMCQQLVHLYEAWNRPDKVSTWRKRTSVKP